MCDQDEIDSIAVRRSDSGGTHTLRKRTEPKLVLRMDDDRVTDLSDSGGGERVAERVLSQLLIELDGIEPLRQVAVIAATNRPDIIVRSLTCLVANSFAAAGFC